MYVFAQKLSCGEVVFFGMLIFSGPLSEGKLETPIGYKGDSAALSFFSVSLLSSTGVPLDRGSLHHMVKCLVWFSQHQACRDILLHLQ